MTILLEDEQKMIEEISNLTNSNYEITNGAISNDNLLVIINELWSLYQGLDDDFRAYERYVEENYKQNRDEVYEYGE